MCSGLGCLLRGPGWQGAVMSSQRWWWAAWQGGRVQGLGSRYSLQVELKEFHVSMCVLSGDRDKDGSWVWGLN